MKKVISLCLLAGVCLTSNMCMSTQKVDSMTFDEKLDRLEQSIVARREAREASEAFKDALMKQYYSVTLDKYMFGDLDDCPVKDTPPPSPRK